MFGFFRPIHLRFVSLVALVGFDPKPLVETGRDLGRIMQGSQKKKEFREELIKRYQDKPGKRPLSRSHRFQEVPAKAEKG